MHLLYNKDRLCGEGLWVLTRHIQLTHSKGISVSVDVYFSSSFSLCVCHLRGKNFSELRHYHRERSKKWKKRKNRKKKVWNKTGKTKKKTRLGGRNKVQKEGRKCTSWGSFCSQRLQWSNLHGPIINVSFQRFYPVFLLLFSEKLFDPACHVCTVRILSHDLREIKKKIPRTRLRIISQNPFDFRYRNGEKNWNS